MDKFFSQQNLTGYSSGGIQQYSSGHSKMKVQAPKVGDRLQQPSSAHSSSKAYSHDTKSGSHHGYSSRYHHHV